MSTVNDRIQPICSAITVVGIEGHSCNNARICGYTASTIDDFAGREYCGGLSAASPRRTVFRPMPNLRSIALIGSVTTATHHGAREPVRSPAGRTVRQGAGRVEGRRTCCHEPNKR
ncbi:hypothetical protein [Micromonospora sonchi]|uniref:hypothetical protein n=1 Tax=Micromonospora sonchi TaxID=1763543 RepID=UPI00166443B3|nr:hypothetical protein [Micromonospora sonchi]